MRRRRIFSWALSFGLASALALTVAEPAAQAHKTHSRHAHKRWRPPVQQPLVSVSLESARGRSLPSIRHRGKTFVAGERGDRYEIRVTNNGATRVEVVVSVDGLDAVSGRPGNFVSQRGYVIEPFGSVVIDGFRTSLERVAAFRFSGVGDSFAAQSGAAHNAGVIGIAAFKERSVAIARRGHGHGSSHAPRAADAPAKKNKSRSRAASPGTTAESSRSWSGPSQELGTRFGESRHSAVREVGFVRRDHRRPDFRTRIHYDSARGLQARGVPIAVEPVWRESPPADAWPAASSGRFAEPPPGWTGRR